MAATLVAGPLSAAVLVLLRGAASLTALVPSDRMTDEMPVRPEYPMILVEAHGESAFDTLGAPDDRAFGSMPSVGVRVLSQYRSDSEIHAIASEIRGVLDGATVTVGTFPPTLLQFQQTAPIFKAAVNLVTTREQVAMYDVTVHHE